MDVKGPRSNPYTHEAGSVSERQTLVPAGDRVLERVSPAVGDAGALAALFAPPGAEDGDSKSERRIPGGVRQQAPGRSLVQRLWRHVRQRAENLVQMTQDYSGILARLVTYGGTGFVVFGPSGAVWGVMAGGVVGAFHQFRTNDNAGRFNWAGFTCSAAVFSVSVKYALEAEQAGQLQVLQPPPAPYDAYHALVALGGVLDLCLVCDTHENG